jgi:hypothetical protein
MGQWDKRAPEGDVHNVKRLRKSRFGPQDPHTFTDDEWEGRLHWSKMRGGSRAGRLVLDGPVRGRRFFSGQPHEPMLRQSSY